MRGSLAIASLNIALAIPAFAANDKNYTYLALGDSVSFGFNPLLAVPGATPSQFVGYPEVVAQEEHLAQSKKEVNLSCPGETSASFLDVSAPDNGCNSPHLTPLGPLPPFKFSIGLHAPYTISQMTFAVSQLAANKHINLVTLSVGANDLLLLASNCSYVSFAQNPVAAACVQSALLPDPTQPTQLGPVMLNYAMNLTVILTNIRANYGGQLVLVTYYSPSTDPLFVEAINLLNGVMRQVGTQFKAKFADGFTAFNTAAAILNHSPSNLDPCQAGLLVQLPGTPATCDVHPSLLGQDVLAATVIVSSAQH